MESWKTGLVFYCVKTASCVLFPIITLEHEFLVYNRICETNDKCTYLFCYLTHFDEKLAKSVQTVLEILTKGDFCA